jgi:hypothetical protein
MNAEYIRRVQRCKAIALEHDRRTFRVGRIFLDERAEAFSQCRSSEFEIKDEIAQFFSIPHRAVCFVGSAQLGFSPHKGTIFDPNQSDLDVACISSKLFEEAWTDVLRSSKGFSDETGFKDKEQAAGFKDGLVRRAMIHVGLMPRSKLKEKWQNFERYLTKKHSQLFVHVKISIYFNEYSFCWKQDSGLKLILGGIDIGENAT